MQVLIFEAKSGKLAAAARRWGLKSLLTNFNELFVEPARQTARLQALLATRWKDVELVDDKGRVVQATTSNAAGQFRFKSVDQGKYKVRVRKDGFQEAELPVDSAPAREAPASMTLR